MLTNNLYAATLLRKVALFLYSPRTPSLDGQGQLFLGWANPRTRIYLNIQTALTN
jgi:hypothetical protein